MGKKAGGGSMYLYEGTQTITINTTDVYHAILGLLEGGANSAFTYQASSVGTITDTADNGGVLRVTDAGHGLTTGDYVTLNGMGDVNHNGVTRVTVIDENTFDCDDIAYNSIEDTGSWQKGANLTVNAGYGGVYSIDYSFSASVAVASKNIRIEPYKNASAIDESACERLFNNTGYGNSGSGGIVSLTTGDKIWLACRNTTDAQDVIIEHGNIHLSK